MQLFVWLGFISCLFWVCWWFTHANTFTLFSLSSLCLCLSLPFHSLLHLFVYMLVYKFCLLCSFSIWESLLVFLLLLSTFSVYCVCLSVCVCVRDAYGHKVRDSQGRKSGWYAQVSEMDINAKKIVFFFFLLPLESTLLFLWRIIFHFLCVFVDCFVVDWRRHDVQTYPQTMQSEMYKYLTLSQQPIFLSSSSMARRYERSTEKQQTFLAFVLPQKTMIASSRSLNNAHMMFVCLLLY